LRIKFVDGLVGYHNLNNEIPNYTVHLLNQLINYLNKNAATSIHKLSFIIKLL